MSPQRVRADDVAYSAWRNGGGVMQELLLQELGPDAWSRVGLADIERDGPFSDFPGVERRLVVLRGAGVVLTVGGVAHRCTVDSGPLVFDGGAVTTCALIDGPTHVLNLLLHGAQGDLRRIEAGEPWHPGRDWCAFYALVAGRLEAAGSAHRVPEGEARTLLSFDPAPESMTFAPARAQPGPVGYGLCASPAAGR